MSTEPVSSTFAGIYGVPEAARYLTVTPPIADGIKIESARLRYWISGSLPILAGLDFPTRQRFISFRGLISMRLIAVLRSRGVSLDAIAATEEWLRTYLNVRWPFVSKPMWTYASDVYTTFGQRLVAASRHGQEAMDFIREWLTRVELDMVFDQNDVVSSWSPYKGIRLDPKLQFGAPCVDGTGIPTGAIWNKIKGGDRQEVVARLYDIDIDAVQRAIEWEKRLDAA